MLKSTLDKIRAEVDATLADWTVVQDRYHLSLNYRLVEVGDTVRLACDSDRVREAWLDEIVTVRGFTPEGLILHDNPAVPPIPVSHVRHV